MKHLIELPDAAFLQACFRYEPETGKLFWKERPRHHFKSDWIWKRFLKKHTGKEAGTELYRPDREPLCLRVKIRTSGPAIMPSVHRIIFRMLGIEIPNGHVVDHKNGNPFDNRFDNLRIATPSQNCCNKKNQRRTLVLPKGVGKTPGGKFRAQCMINGKAKVIGAAYATAEEAHQAYCDYASKVHGEFFRAS